MKIGNYIHYRYEHYLRSGLSIYGDSPPSPQTVFAAQRQKLLKDVLNRRADKEKANIKFSLEQQLNFFFDPQAIGTVQFGYTPQESQALQDKIISLCQEALGNLSVADIDWTTLKVKSNGIKNIGIGRGELYEEFRKIRETRLGREGQGATTAVALSRRLKALMDLRDSLGNDVEDGSLDAQFITKMNKFQQDYESIVRDLIQISDGANKQTSLGLSKKKIAITDKNANFIKELQELIDDTKQMTIQQINGLLGEYIPVLTQAVLSNVASKGLEETLENLSFSQELLIPVWGGQKSHKGLVSSNVITKRKNISDLSVETTILDIPIKVGNTFDKIDIQLQVPDSTPINASVKNIRNRSKIEILDGRSSLEFLQSYPEFANHYLNITAMHPYDPDTYVQQAHDTMKLTIALHALAGGSWAKAGNGNVFATNPMAEIFILNRHGHFEVYFMSDILENVANNLDLIDIQGFRNFNSVHRWENEYVGQTPMIKAAYRRIANLLAQLHTQQLKVSIKTAALT